MRRALAAALGSVVGAVVGGAFGAAWFERFGSEAEIFGEYVAAFQAGVVAAVAGGAWGWWFEEWRRTRSLARALAVIAWLGCGGLLVVGIVYIGGWTNADGPDAEATVGILGIPAGVIGTWIVARSLRGQATASSQQPG